MVQGRWLYGREDETLHELLTAELKGAFPEHADKVDLGDCAFSGRS